MENDTERKSVILLQDGNTFDINPIGMPDSEDKKLSNNSIELENDGGEQPNLSLSEKSLDDMDIGGTRKSSKNESISSEILGTTSLNHPFDANPIEIQEEQRENELKNSKQAKEEDNPATELQCNDLRNDMKINSAALLENSVSIIRPFSVQSVRPLDSKTVTPPPFHAWGSEEKLQYIAHDAKNKTRWLSPTKLAALKRVAAIPWRVHVHISEDLIFRKNWLTAIIIAVGLVLLPIIFWLFWTQNLTMAYKTNRRVSGTEEKWVPPDLIGCPGGQKNQRHQVWYNQSLLARFNKTGRDLDILVDRIVQNDVKFPSSLILMAKSLKANDNKDLLKAVWDKRWYENALSDAEMMEASKKIDRRILLQKIIWCRYKPFDCSRGRLVWIMNSSLCMMWDNRNLKTKRNIYIYFGSPRFRSPSQSAITRWWLGNLEFEEIISLDSFSQARYGIRFKVIPYHYKKSIKKRSTICQDNIHHFDNNTNSLCKLKKSVSEDFWAYDATRYSSAGSSIRCEMEYFIEITDIHLFTSFQVVQAMGGFIGTVMGISVFKIILILPFIPVKFGKLSVRQFRFVTLALGVILFVGFVGLQYYDIQGIFQTRYQNETSAVQTNEFPSPTVRFCTDPELLLDYEKLEQYNVSRSLLNFLSITSFHRPLNFVFPGGFDFQNLSFAEEHYRGYISPHRSKLMTYDQIETSLFSEYDQLLDKLKMNNLLPGYEIFKQFLKNPCTFIDKCTIGAELIPNCCKNNIKFIHKARSSSRFLCLLFDNGNGKFTQKAAGKEFGLKIYLKLEHLKHNYDNIYLGQKETAFLNITGYTIPNLSFGMGDLPDPNFESRLSYRDAIYKILISQKRFGVYDAVTEKIPYSGGTDLEIKLSAESVSVLNNTRKYDSQCSEHPKCFIHRYSSIVHREIFWKSLCGCHICTINYIPEFSESCCTAKQMYKCFTQDWLYPWNRIEYPMHCDWNYDKLPDLPNIYFKVAGVNFPIQKHDFTNGICNAADWPTMNRSNFYPYVKDKPNPADCREPCHKIKYIFESAKTSFRANLKQKNLAMVNIYISVPFIKQIKEMDTIEPILVFSLIAGGLSFILGFSSIELIGFIIFGLEKFLIVPGTTWNKLKMCGKKLVTERRNLREDLFVTASNVIYSGFVILFLILCAWSCLYLNFKNDTTPVTHFALRDASGVYPSVALCINSKKMSNLEKTMAQISQFKCSVYGEHVDCRHVFPYLLSNEESGQTCFLSNGKFKSYVKGKVIPTVYNTELKVRIGKLNEDSFWVWVGSWYSLRNFEVFPEYKLVYNESLHLGYKLSTFREVSHTFGCTNGQHVIIKPCSIADKKVGLCSFLNDTTTLHDIGIKYSNRSHCLKENIIVSEANKDPVTESYEFRVHLSMTQIEEYTETYKLTWFDKLCLYFGFIDVYLGIAVLCTIQNLLSVFMKHEHPD